MASPQGATQAPTTPPRSRTSSASSNTSRKSSKSPLSIDLSNLPPLSEPSPPSNTLLVTNLQDPTIFTAPLLAHLHDLITTSSPTGLLAFSPLPSLRRLILTFPDIPSATRIRTLLDGETLFSNRLRVYFGAHTDVARFLDGTAGDGVHRLALPRAQKQFFISPPPSPPAGWESREEEPPNKEVHPGDLGEALLRLERQADPGGPAAAATRGADAKQSGGEERRQQVFGEAMARGRSGSTPVVLYQPEAHGSGPELPAIAVEDTGAVPDEEEEGAEADDTITVEAGEGGGRIIAHTSRPPVELMS